MSTVSRIRIRCRAARNPFDHFEIQVSTLRFELKRTVLHDSGSDSTVSLSPIILVWIQPNHFIDVKIFYSYENCLLSPEDAPPKLIVFFFFLSALFWKHAFVCFIQYMYEQTRISKMNGEPTVFHFILENFEIIYFR
jgi:hypothetical protein